MTETSTREREMERAGEVMREFMARAVLFQDAVAKWGGLNGTDLQCASLLMSDGPATPGELAARTGLTAGGGATTPPDRPAGSPRHRDSRRAARSPPPSTASSARASFHAIATRTTVAG